MNQSLSSSKGTVKWEELQKSGNICDKYIRCLSKILKDDQNINDKGNNKDFVLPFEDIELVSYINRQCHAFLFKTRPKSTANTTNWKAVIPRVGEDEEWGSPGFKKAAEQQGLHSTYNLRHTQQIIYSEFSLLGNHPEEILKFALKNVDVNISCTAIFSYSKLKVSPLRCEWISKLVYTSYGVSSAVHGTWLLTKKTTWPSLKGLMFKEEVFKRPYQKKKKSIYSTFSNKLTFRDNNSNPEVLQGGKLSTKKEGEGWRVCSFSEVVALQLYSSVKIHTSVLFRTTSTNLT